MQSHESASELEPDPQRVDPQWALRERVKELDTLLHVSGQAHEATSVQELIQSVVKAIPAGWQYPEATAARIELGEAHAQTSNYRDTPWSQTEEIAVSGDVVGQLTVAYLERFPEADDGPFLAEERRLLHAIVNEVGGAVERLRREDTLVQLATHEEVTGLFNRQGIIQAILQRVADQPNRPYGHFAIDLDRLWEVNRNFGFATGDALVAGLAKRLIEQGWSIASREGRRIVFVVDDLEEAVLGRFLEDQILPLLDEPFDLSPAPSPIMASYVVAASHYPAHSDDPWTVATLADAAASRATRAHRRSLVANPEIDGPRQFALDTMSQIRAGVAASEFVLHYQPQVDSSGDLQGVEALIRWDHNGRLIPPSEFIDIAEDSGLLADLLTPLVCFRAFTQAAAWLAEGLRVPMSVNLSPSSLMADSVVDLLTYTLQGAGLEADQVEVEVTEGAVMRDLPKAAATLGELRSHGIRVALDDFGTGYSSLALLRQLPVDIVKIDRSFVASALTVPADAVIVQSIIEMARAVGAETVAEGVEDKETADWLWSRGVTRIQGYYFARPLHPDDIPAWRWNGTKT